MTNQQHPITPPPELVQQWVRCTDASINGELAQRVAIQAARWGADQELEACITWVAIESLEAAKELRAARRPKPPSLKEKALAALARLNTGALCANPIIDRETVRRALEHLDD